MTVAELIEKLQEMPQDSQVSVNINPCHVCGGKPHITATSTIGGFFGMVSCMDEHHTVQVRAEAKTLEEAEALAIEKWNRRHYPPEVMKAVERMN